MARVRVTVTGVQQVAKRLDRMSTAVADAVVAEVERIAEDVARMASAAAPRRTGRMASTIRSRKLPGRRFVKGTAREVIAGGAQAPYALSVHQGTKRYRGKPFLRDSFEREAGDLDERIGRAIARALGRESVR